MVLLLFITNKRFNVNFFIANYHLRSGHAAKHVWMAFVTSALPPLCNLVDTVGL